MNYRKKGRKKKKELWSIYSFSMGHIEEKNCHMSQIQLEDVGPDRAQGHESVTAPNFQKLQIWKPNKRLYIILIESPWLRGCCELQPNVIQVLKIRTCADRLGLMQHDVSGKTVFRSQLGMGWRKPVNTLFVG